jgi:hypothetical protein
MLSKGQSLSTIQALCTAFEQRDIGFRKMVQDGLRAEGYYSGSIDSTWGAETEASYNRLMSSARYQRQVSKWTWSREVKIIETLLFLYSDARSVRTPPVSWKLSAVLLFLYFLRVRDRAMIWDIHWNEGRLY